MKTAFITGATSGIGRAAAVLMAKNGYKLILCGRRKKRLEELSIKLKTHTQIRTLCFDVREQQKTEELISGLPAEWQEIDVLINNAGNAHGLAPIDKGNVEDWDTMLDINVKGLLYVSRSVIPGMVSRKKGHILNIGSIAGHEVYPDGNVYCASKHAVNAITKGMRQDLTKHGIRVSTIDPGLVDTEFSLVRFKGDHAKAENVYKGMEPLHAEDIAETILFVLSRPPHVNVADLLLLPASQAGATNVVRDKTR